MGSFFVEIGCRLGDEIVLCEGCDWGDFVGKIAHVWVEDFGCFCVKMTPFLSAKLPFVVCCIPRMLVV